MHTARLSKQKNDAGKAPLTAIETRRSASATASLFIPFHKERNRTFFYFP